MFIPKPSYKLNDLLEAGHLEDIFNGA